MKVTFLFLFFTLCYFPLAVGQNDTEFDKWTVSYVVDGDTFFAEHATKPRTKFRLIGIDTPESKHPDKPVEAFSKEASTFMRKLIMNKTVLLEYDVQTHDRYGRPLVYVYLEDLTFINDLLVAEGLAQVTTFPPNVKFANVFTATQIMARKNEKGMWAKL